MDVSKGGMITSNNLNLRIKVFLNMKHLSMLLILQSVKVSIICR